MSTKDDNSRSQITEILSFLREIFGRFGLAVMLSLILALVILAVLYSTHAFLTRQSYSDLAQNYMGLADINKRQLDNLKECWISGRDWKRSSKISRMRLLNQGMSLT